MNLSHYVNLSPKCHAIQIDDKILILPLLSTSSKLTFNKSVRIKFIKIEVKGLKISN